jgi:NAD(P)-dependent dehydrogenase (short-subunit alcohol dehydrogenase family)
LEVERLLLLLLAKPWPRDFRTTAALPAGRMGKPEELVAAIMFLCSDQARFITGHTLPVGGGFLAQ